MIFLFISSCPASAYTVLGKGQFYFLVITSQKGGRKLGGVSLESSGQILEETKRIWDPLQFTGK